MALIIEVGLLIEQAGQYKQKNHQPKPRHDLRGMDAHCGKQDEEQGQQEKGFIQCRPAIDLAPPVHIPVHGHRLHLYIGPFPRTSAA